MVKARSRNPVAATTKATPDIDKKVEAFAAGADLNPGETAKPAAPAELDRNASRDFKSIRVPFNEYEYEVLEKLCKHENRSKLNMLRQAMLQEAERLGLI